MERESFRNNTPYHYSYNNPVSFKDSIGLDPKAEMENEVQVTSSPVDGMVAEINLSCAIFYILRRF